MGNAATATQKITYRQYREKRQEEFNALPIFYAFTNEQLAEGMKEHWKHPGKCPYVKNAGKYLYSLGDTGGYYYKEDAEVIRQYFNRHDPLDDLMKDPAFAESAFYYEMGNHEYHINNWQGNWDVLSCFGDIEYDDCDDYNVYFDQLNFSPEIREAYKRARSRFLKAADENDWY